MGLLSEEEGTISFVTYYITKGIPAFAQSVIHQSHVVCDPESKV